MKVIRTSWLSASMVVVFAVCAATHLIAAPIAGPILNPATGHYYYLLENSNWTDAQSQALSLGGNLATVDDAAENAWISQTFSNFGGAMCNLWIGLNAIGHNGGNPNNYHWVDGSPSTYRNWAPLEPNFSDQYVYILPGGLPNAGKWNNAPDQLSVGYQYYPAIPNYGVVEAVLVPEPSTFTLAGLSAVVFISGCRLRRRS